MATNHRIRKTSRQRLRPRLEALEDRITPTTFTPTTFADDGTPNSLRGAITQANADTGSALDIIQLSAGTPYQLTLANAAGKHERANAQGDLNITSTKHGLLIRGATDAQGHPTTTIQQTVLDRVFQVLTTGFSVTFEDLIIEGGQAQDDGSDQAAAGSTEADGGGILDDGGDVTLTNVILRNNSARAGAGFGAVGGGILAEAGGSLAVQSSIIQANGASAGDAAGTSINEGGTAAGGGIFASCKMAITDSTLSDNVVTGGNADKNKDGGNGGEALGGGVYAVDETTITHSILSGNTVTGGAGDTSLGGGAFGGGVYAQGPTTITASTLSGNTVQGGSSSGRSGGSAYGGGVFANGPTTITASTLSGNTLQGGSGGSGGIAIGGGAAFGGTANELVNSTIADNQVIGGRSASGASGAFGGGLFFGNFSPGNKTTATLTNVTVAGNKASLPQGGETFGGGIDNDSGAVTLVNTLVARNSAITGPDYAGVVGTGSGHNLIGDATGSNGFSVATQGDLLGTTANPLDPRLGPLQDNGGPTQTLALLPGSPALNAGDDSVQSVGPFDQRGQGFTRGGNGPIDIGAFEAQPPPSPPPSPGGSSPTPKPPPALQTPPLLALFDSLLHGVEAINGNDTETVTDSVFGTPLLVSIYDGSGDLISVTLFGINVTALFEM